MGVYSPCTPCRARTTLRAWVPGRSCRLPSPLRRSAIRRRRQCEACGARFTTFERIQLRELTVVKSEGRREAFEREYLLTQINRFGGNISRTANFVGMERSALHRKLKFLGVQAEDRAPSTPIA